MSFWMLDPGSFYQDYVRSGLLWTYVLAFVIFAGWQAMIWALVEFVLPTTLLAYSTTFSEISFIVGGLYAGWIIVFRQGYTDGPRQLSSLEQVVRRFMKQLYATLQPYDTDQVSLRTLQHANHAIQRLHFTAKTLIHDLFALMVDDAPTEFHEDVLQRQWVQHEHFPLLRQLNPTEHVLRMDRAIQLMTAELKTLERRQVLTPSDHRNLYADLREVRDTVDQMHSGRRVMRPPYIDNHTSFVLAFYFLLFFPLTLALRSDWFSIIVYPTLMVMFMGYAIIRMWLQPPFSRYRRYRAMPFLEWRRQSFQFLDMMLANHVQLVRQHHGSEALRFDRDRTVPESEPTRTPQRFDVADYQEDEDENEDEEDEYMDPALAQVLRMGLVPEP